MSDRLNHRIALAAEQAVEGAAKLPADKQKEFRSLAEGFPTLLRTAGLLQSVAFLKAKAKPKTAHGTVLDHFTAQFRQLGLLKEKDADLVKRVLSLSTIEYMAWTRIADRAAYWQKRFAQALLKRPEEA
jgi:CRISPR type III-B/RAMP module-associated protein Cmr5